jgi:hypothetical protein
MQVLNLIEKNECPFNFRLGKELGIGADGSTYDLFDEQNKVIKLSVIYEYLTKVDLVYEQYSKVLDYLISYNDPVYVRVYAHAKIGIYNRKHYNNHNKNYDTQEYLLHYYIMEKCLPLLTDEAKVFDSILPYLDGKWRKYSDESIKKILDGLSRGLDFDKEKVIIFCNNYLRSKVRQDDLHARNIMKDIAGNYKIIDLDRCLLK